MIKTAASGFGAMSNSFGNERKTTGGFKKAAHDFNIHKAYNDPRDYMQITNMVNRQQTRNSNDFSNELNTQGDLVSTHHRRSKVKTKPNRFGNIVGRR